jgi:hypothetical protein
MEAQVPDAGIAGIKGGEGATRHHLFYEPTTVTRHALGVKLLVVLMFMVIACGGGESAEEEAQEARTIPESPNDTHWKRLPAGEYTSDEFEPAMSFRLEEEGWRTWNYVDKAFGSKLTGVVGREKLVEMSDYLAVAYAPEGDLTGSIEFMDKHWVYEPMDHSGYEAIPRTPEDMVAWLQENPNLETDEPEPAHVGGEDGMQLDAVASHLFPEYSLCTQFKQPCLPLFRNAADPGSLYVLTKTEKARFVVLDDVKGKAVTIAITAPAVKFDEFTPEAEKMLDSVVWRGS